MISQFYHVSDDSGSANRLTTLSREEARGRLQRLVPGTEEYSKLESILIKTSGICEISLPNLCYKVNTISANNILVGGFGSSEHLDLAKNVLLNGLPKDTPLLVRGTVPIHFNQIVALAGDFYGVVNGAISLPGGDDEAKKARFIKAFETLEKSDSNIVRKIISFINNELDDVEHAALHHHCYSSSMVEKSQAINNIKNDVNQLLIDNSDHFYKDAREAYRIGHQTALTVAREAGREVNEQLKIEKLKRAYAIDAFACHFLTDLFSAGHIRNQRGDLEKCLIQKLGFSEANAKPLAGILTGAQHEYDGKNGLNVSNNKNEVWRAYGDGWHFHPNNRANRLKAMQTIQQSTNEVFSAYDEPDLPLLSLVLDLVPTPTAINSPPLYQLSEDLTLTLYQGIKETIIKSKKDFLTHGLSHALRYLPEEYVNSFLKPFRIPDLPLLKKVIVPQIERLTNCVWHIVGLSTYHQMQVHQAKLSDKLDEMAQIIDATYKSYDEVINRLDRINATLDRLLIRADFSELEKYIGKIKVQFHSLYINNNPNQYQNVESKLVKYVSHIHHIVMTEDGSGKIITKFKNNVINSTKDKNNRAVTLEATLWFRNIIDYQINAFILSRKLTLHNNRPTLDIAHQASRDKEMLTSVQKFECSLQAQIDFNIDEIDASLIYESSKYIELQIKKTKLIMDTLV